MNHHFSITNQRMNRFIQSYNITSAKIDAKYDNYKNPD